MTTSADWTPGNEAPNERLSSLTAAMLRISASLDLKTVLREVVESARALTGARYGAIATSTSATSTSSRRREATSSRATRRRSWSCSPRRPRAPSRTRARTATSSARADLAALVETSPVGVVVLDARTGRVVLLNREGRRIVESLHIPGRTAEELLKVLTCRRGDGREIAPNQFSLASALSSAETVRGEKIVLSTPDGRSITTLVNATPIQTEDGAVASVVVTLQNLAPFEEVDRMRAEFLGMVSHELRTPLAAIKGSTPTVLGPTGEFGAAEIQQFFRIIDEQADRMSGFIGDLLDDGRIHTGTLSVSPEPSEVGALVDYARTTFVVSDRLYGAIPCSP